jgi:predicted ATPase
MHREEHKLSRGSVLSNDGADMAAALQTIQEIGDPDAMAETVADAFPGSSISVLNIEGRFEIAMHQHGLLRPLRGTREHDDLQFDTIRKRIW